MIHVAHIIFLLDQAAPEPDCWIQIFTLPLTSWAPSIPSFGKRCQAPYLTRLPRRLDESALAECSLDNNSPRVSCVCAHLVSRSTDCLSCGLFLQGCLSSKQPRKTGIASPSNAKVGEVCLLSIIKDLVSLSSEFLFCNSAHCCASIAWPFFGNRGSES